jgi:hypothetical protein
MKMKASIKVQCLIVELVAVTSIIIVTILSITILQQLVGIFYTATINSILITVIIVVAARWVHNRFVMA